MENKAKSLLLLHFIVFIWGFTGIFGREISLAAIPLTWWRIMLALIAISIFAWVSGKSLRASLPDISRFALTGLFTALHWVFFFASIKASNISVALAILSTTSFFVALVAPFIRKTSLLMYELVLGALVITGLFIIFRFEFRFITGIVLSLLAALCAAIFSSRNSVHVTRFSPTLIAFYEMTSGLIFLSVVMMFSGDFLPERFTPLSSDWIWLILLSVVATAFAFIAGIEVMKVLSPFTCALTINLEPLYTIVFALLIYREEELMSTAFYIGAAIILSTLFLDALLKRSGIKKKAT